MSGDTGHGTAPKQPYSAPRLIVYGDIATLTQATALARPKFDGNSKLKTRTR